MLAKQRKYARAWLSAFKAGWIAHRCTTGCVVDDEQEEIWACAVHADEIARLKKINDENQ